MITAFRGLQHRVQDQDHVVDIGRDDQTLSKHKLLVSNLICILQLHEVYGLVQR